MAWFAFSKFKPCNDQKVYNAVKAGCIASEKSVIGAYYALNGDTLVISFIRSVRGGIADHMDEAVAVTKDMIPGTYSNVEFWDKERFSNECPEKVKNTTGYVSMFTPENNKV